MTKATVCVLWTAVWTLTAGAAPPASESVKAPAPAALVQAATPDVTVAAVDGLDAAIAAHRGKVVVVNFWSTWCRPCVEELPVFRQFNERKAGADVALLGFCADAPKTRVKVASFALKHNLAYPILIMDMRGDPDAVVRHFGEEMTGSLPTTLVYDRQGHIAVTHTGEIDYDALVKLVDDAMHSGK